jgi:hypothetical protein
MVICLVATTLVAGGYIGQILSAENRLYMMFNWQDTIVVLALIAGFGLVATGIFHFGAWITRGLSDKWLSPWFYFLAVLIIFNLKLIPREWLAIYFPWLSPHAYYLMIWGLGLALTLGGYVLPTMKKWASAGWRGLVVMSPVLLIIPWSLMMAPKWENVSGNPSRLGLRECGNRAPMVIIILDMIGYQDAFRDDGMVRDELAHLKEFSNSAMVFHRARSPGYCTVLALPGMLLQEEVMYPLLEKDGVRWKTRRDPEAPARLANEFSMALPYRFRMGGGRAVYFGYHLPYKNMMPGAWDDAFILPYSQTEIPGVAAGWASKCLHHILQYVQVSKDPISGLVKQIDPVNSWKASYHRKLTMAVFNAGMDYLHTCLSPGDLAIVHLPVPHWPYVFDAQGNAVSNETGHDSKYMGQLQYADQLFGKMMLELKTNGKWNGAWVVAMSDHGLHEESWDRDSEEQRHVPFMVKAPGQTVRKDVHDPIRIDAFDRIPGFALPESLNQTNRRE